jgi:hemoglobin
MATMTREPHPKAPGVDAGITEAVIRSLVHVFYARVRSDPLLGPVFSTRVEDWPSHLEKLCAFWSSVMLMTGRYKGTPMKAHAELPEIAPKHFRRWLELCTRR